MTMRTPLAKVRGLGAAGTGTGHWWLQRLTAAANVPLVIFLIAFVVSHLGADRATLLASLQNPLAAVLVILALLSIFMHMRLGMQVIIEDYVHGHAAKLALLLLNTFFTVAMAAAALFAVLKMGLAS
jgi:succinate dehydrogenase / fumarate reductase membrane anchor subunit